MSADDEPKPKITPTAVWFFGSYVIYLPVAKLAVYIMEQMGGDMTGVTELLAIGWLFAPLFAIVNLAMIVIMLLAQFSQWLATFI